MAAVHGTAERTLAVLSKGSIDIDQGDPEGATPLMMSAGVGSFHVVNVLLKHGANTSIADDDGFTALHMSADCCHLRVTKVLLKAGASVDLVTNKGYTPLHLSADEGHWEVMAALIEAGSNPDSRLPNGETPLCSAASKGHMAATKVLLRAHANASLSKTDDRGSSFVPLDFAALNGHADVVGELVQQLGIKACGGPSGGVEALRLAALAQRLDIMEILLEAGVTDTGTVLIVATGRGFLAAAKLLLQHRREGRLTASRSAYVSSSCGGYGAPPLIHATGFAGCCSSKIARLLIDAGAATSSKIQITDKRGSLVFNDTPLAFANIYLSSKKVGGARDATKDQLNELEAIRRLLLQVEAVHAVSWVWPSLAPRVSCTMGTSTRVKSACTPPTPVTLMLSTLRRRASMHRRVVMPAAFRWVVTCGCRGAKGSMLNLVRRCGVRLSLVAVVISVAGGWLSFMLAWRPLPGARLSECAVFS